MILDECVLVAALTPDGRYWSPSELGKLTKCGFTLLALIFQTSFPVHNPVDIVEHALSKGASTVLVPVSCRRALVDLSDEAATKVQVLFYSDAADAMRKVLHEG